MSCWNRRTPLETLFIMKLCCSVPFTIFLIIMYSIFGIVEYNVYYCLDECETKQENLNLDLQEDDLCDYNIESKSNCYFPEKDVKSPIMASLSESIYLDDPVPARFKCPAVIMTREYALTSSRCFKEEILDQLYVRSASDYWSQGGIVHRIDKVIRANQENLTLVALEVSPTFPLTRLINFVRIEEHSNLINSHTFSWKMNTRANFFMGKKYATIEDLNLYFDNGCEQSEFDIVCKFNTTDLCLLQPGSPILSKDNKILGFLMDVDCENETNNFYFHSINKYSHWLTESLKFNNSGSLSTPCKMKRDKNKNKNRS